MIRPVEIKPLPNYRLWIKYSDGTEGEVDLSHLAGKGVFSSWKDPHTFTKAHIGDHGALIWDDNIDLCPDALYMQITGKSVEQVFPNLKKSA